MNLEDTCKLLFGLEVFRRFISHVSNNTYFYSDEYLTHDSSDTKSVKRQKTLDQLLSNKFMNYENKKQNITKIKEIFFIL